jgi:membrane-associated protease RseP (regulator of RpoE activity)
MRLMKSSLLGAALGLAAALCVAGVSLEASAQESGGASTKESKAKPGKAARAAGQKAAGQEAAGQEAAGQKAAGQKAAGQKAAGQKAAGQKAAGQKAAGQKAAGQRAGGLKASTVRVAPGALAAGESAAPEVLREQRDPFQGVLGAMVGLLTPERREALGAPPTAGIHVARILPGSIAEVAGVEPGDVIIDVGGEPVTSADDVAASLAQKRIGDLLTVQVIRAGGPKTLAVTLTPPRQVDGKAQVDAKAVEGSSGGGAPAKASLDGELHFGTSAPATDAAQDRREKRLKRMQRRVQWLKHRIKRHKRQPHRRWLYR